MQGCKGPLWLMRAAIVAGAICAGCHTEPPEGPTPAPAPTSYGEQYRENEIGAIEGQVLWEGPPPAAAPFKVLSVLARGARPDQPNGRVPLVDPQVGGLAGAAIFLRQVDPRKSRPWDHETPRLEHSALQLHLVQGSHRGNLGVVKTGAFVEMLTTDEEIHLVRGRGAAFFSVPLVELGRVSKRRMDKPGLVEITSGTGFFWMSAHLWVSDHPYFTRTDDHGRFRLDHVPPGDYELVCWLPNWKTTRFLRDPEFGMVTEVQYRPNAERRIPIQVRTGETAKGEFRLSDADF